MTRPMTPRSCYFIITQVLDLWDPGRIVPITSRRGSSEADVKRWERYDR